jgi:hypothetical protein
LEGRRDEVTMSIVALLMQYKSDGRPGRCGPGDTLRLAHALRHPSLAPNEDVTVISTLAPDVVAGLIPARRFKTIPPTDREKTGPVSHAHFRRLLDEHMGTALAGAQAIHAFIGCEDYPWNATRERSPAGREYTRRRVDSSRPANSLMFHSKWMPPARRRASDSVLAAYIRRMETSPERNTPDWFCDIVRERAPGCGYKILWCGSVGSFVPRAGEEVLSGVGSLRRQIDYLGSHATCALGWNSGGLDLAAAAGLPILRVGEFQRVQGWGALYNSYLATATCVGLEPSHRATVDFDRKVVTKSITALLANPELFEPPRHVILRPGQALSNDPEQLKAQLVDNEIPWPGAKSA